jgi:hypothetical protein
VESSCELGNGSSGSIKCWKLPSGCTTCGLFSGTQPHRVSSVFVIWQGPFINAALLHNVESSRGPNRCRIARSCVFISLILVNKFCFKQFQSCREMSSAFPYNTVKTGKSYPSF